MMNKLIQDKIDLVYKEIQNIYDNNGNNSDIEKLYESINYHFKIKGKMLRPAFMITVNEDLNGSFEKIKQFATALELIHNYSLIHDDLPAMDNDDYRRGQLTIHKKFDEATGILAGDFLLTKAFEIVSRNTSEVKDSQNYLKAINILALNANDTGMIGGQILDINPKLLNSPEAIYKMYEYKTAALFKSAFTIPGIMNNLKEDSMKILERIGKNFGILFQILDDISDLEEDKAIGKVTLFKYYNIDEINNITAQLKEKLLIDLDTMNLNLTKELMEDLYVKKQS